MILFPFANALFSLLSVSFSFRTSYHKNMCTAKTIITSKLLFTPLLESLRETTKTRLQIWEINLFFLYGLNFFSYNDELYNIIIWNVNLELALYLHHLYSTCCLNKCLKTLSVIYGKSYFQYTWNKMYYPEMVMFWCGTWNSLMKCSVKLMRYTRIEAR